MVKRMSHFGSGWMTTSCRTALAALVCGIVFCAAGCAAVPKNYRDATLDDMYPILSPEEFGTITGIGSDADIARYVDAYWKGTDTTAGGLMRKEYEQRLAYANRYFPDRKGSGHSDRKRIYVLHGPPAFVDHSEFVSTKLGAHSTVKSMETWVYLEPGRYRSFPSAADDVYPGYKKFIFADLFSTGNYVIIYSSEDEEDVDLRMLRQP